MLQPWQPFWDPERSSSSVYFRACASLYTGKDEPLQERAEATQHLQRLIWQHDFVQAFGMDLLCTAFLPPSSSAANSKSYRGDSPTDALHSLISHQTVTSCMHIAPHTCSSTFASSHKVSTEILSTALRN